MTDYATIKSVHVACAAAWVAAQAVFLYIVAVAVTRNPLVVG